MKVIRLFLLSVLTVAAVGHAQEPQETSTDNWNVRVFPLGLLIGAPNVRLDYKIASQWVIGPKIGVMDFSWGGIKITSVSAGINAAYYFNPLFQHSWYIDFGAEYSRLNLTSTNSSESTQTTDVTNFGASVIGGYHWFWNHFNLNVGLGLASNSAGTLQAKDSAGNVVSQSTLPAISAAADASLGWTF